MLISTVLVEVRVAKMLLYKLIMLRIAVQWVMHDHLETQMNLMEDVLAVQVAYYD